MYCFSISPSLLLSLLQILFLSGAVSSLFLVQPKDKTIVRGETVVFKCQVTVDVVNIYWYYSQGTVPGSVDKWISINSNIESTLDYSKRKRYSIIGDHNQDEYFLQIRNVSTEDVGEYKCYYYPAKPTSHNGSPEALLVLLDPPKTPLCTMIKADTVIPSPTVTMRCTSTGTPTPQIVWLRNGNPIDGNVPRASLNMISWNVTETNRGDEFSCIVDYPKMATPPSCKLTPLQVNPVVSVEPSVQTLALNKSGKFVCESTDIPGPLKFKWFINGEVPSRMMKKDVHFRVKHDGKTLKILWTIKELNNTEVTCRVTGRNDMIVYGSARAYVSDTENDIFPKVTVITMDKNTGGTDTNGTTGGHYINGGNKKSSDFSNSSGTKGELNQGTTSNGTVIGIVLSILVLFVLVVVLAIFLYKRNNEINKSGKRFSTKFMQFVVIHSDSNNESAGDVNKDGSTGETNETSLYAKPSKIKKRSDTQYVTENNVKEELAPSSSKPTVLPRLVSKKKENTYDTSCAVMESSEAEASLAPTVDCQETTSNKDEITEINTVENQNESETYKSRSLLRSIAAMLPTEKISAFVNDLRPEKSKRTFTESMQKLRTKIIPKRGNKQEDKVSVEDDCAAIDVEETAAGSEERVDVVTEQDDGVKKSEVEEPDVAEESDDIPSSLPSEHTTYAKPVLRRHRSLAVDSSDSTANKPDASNKRSSLTLDNLLANVKRRSLSRRFSGFENRGSSPDLRISRRFDKNDIVHFVPLGKGNDMTGNVEVVKNRNSINFENEMSQTLLKSFHTVVPNQPEQTNGRIIEDFPSYENLDEKESCTSDGSAYMTDDFSDDDEFDAEEGKPVERVAPMRIIDDTAVYENTEIKPLSAKESLTNNQTDGSANTVALDLGNTTKPNKPTMRVKPTPTPRSFRKLYGSNNSSPVTKQDEHYQDLSSNVRKKNTVEDPTTGESIYDNVEYKI